MRCLLLFAVHVAANAWYDSMPVIFWGNIAPNKQTASVVVPIKGCLKQTTQVTLQLVGPCSGSTNLPVLIGGNITSGNLAQGIVLTVNNCKDIFTNPSPQDRVFYAAQTDQSCQPTACAGGITLATCKLAQVCPAKAKWPKECAAATKCDMNVCGGCAPIFLNDAGSQVCSPCPDLTTPSVCKTNPCDFFPKTNLQCPQAASASFCLPVTCGGCKAQWYDTYGRPVCASPPCSTNSANLGKGVASLGFALTNGQCKAVQGKKSPIALFKDANQCTINCVCVDNGFVDFGNCNQNLGFTVVRGACQSVQGCPERKTSLKSTFFDSLSACTATCSNLAGAAGGFASAAAGSASAPAAGISRLPSSSSSSSAISRLPSSIVCPPGVVPQQCDNPCSTARIPLCAEARGKDIRCVANYCGTCSATWTLNGQPFSCPIPQSCVGTQNCCANSGQAPRDCSAFPCDIKTCGGAATCSADPCRQCAPTFRDAQGNDIPPSMCINGNNPDAFIKCGAGNPNCCKSGFRPLVCLPPPGMLNSTCAKIDCGNSLATNGQTCVADPCDSCSLEVLNAQGVMITDQCQMIPPVNVCTRVQCPAMTTPNCTARPPQCAGQNLVCIKDQCACQWRWYSVGIRSPSADCAAALEMCYPSSVCPTNYACDDLPANMRAQLAPAVAAQLTCIQEPCTCRPILAPPVYGLRQPCNGGNASCCPDGLLKAQCPVQQVQWTCSRVVCDGYTPDKCRADGCNKCQMQILDKSQNVIPQGKCHLKLDTEMQSVCAKVQCPTTTAVCSPRPSCYPADWNLVCIHDPCSCRSLWVDQDLRPGITSQCSAQLVTDCVTPEQCPQKFECNDITPEIAAKLSPQVRASLVCIQEPCTCRPVSTSPSALPPGFRLPCSGGSCCADGRGPLVCPADLAASTCASVQCSGITISSCVADGCNNCAIKVLGPNGAAIAPGQCRLPLNVSSICPGTVCPPINTPPNCGPRPSACPANWLLRCIRDPCVCSRNIWVDEDVRIADATCTAAIQPPCATLCPTNFSCPGLTPPLRCIQERCTCRAIVDPLSIPVGGVVAPTVGPSGIQSQDQQQQQGGKAGKGKASG